MSDPISTFYAANCTACHGEAGAGDGPAAASLDPKPTDFTSPDFKAKPDDELQAVVDGGKGTMPAFETPILAAEGVDTAKLVAYLKGL
jgi:mono/diheme cytochrome c family protein